MDFLASPINYYTFVTLYFVKITDKNAMCNTKSGAESLYKLENTIYLSGTISHTLISYFHQEGERVIGFKCQDVLSVGLKSHIYFLSYSFCL